MRLQRNRLLNVWLREFRPELLEQLYTSNQVEIPVIGGRIIARCRHFSPSGFHRFEETALIDSRGRVQPIEDISALAQLLVNGHEGVPDILERIQQSSDASIEHALYRTDNYSGVSAVELEQSLWLGHPFHPLAKCVGGFSNDDAERFSPERSARFQLHWLLVNRSLVAEFRQDPHAPVEMDQRLLDASGISANDLGDCSLFPCHPWQAPRLEEDPFLSQWIGRGDIRLRGPCGDVAIPTSSVRTVWFPERKLFVKLPIGARITNFPRVNTHAQIARSVVGSKAVSYAEVAVAQAGFSILAEPVGRILHTVQNGTDQQYHANTGFLLRNADFGAGTLPLIVAGLLETDPASGKANLAKVCGHRLQAEENVEQWLAAYTRVTLVPLLHLFSVTGIALEAHTQNSLVRFVDGWPTRLYVRDLEGVAVDRDTFEQRFGTQAETLHDVLFYDRETAWRRLLYYVVVNHYANVVATVADVAGVGEADLWVVAARTLREFSHIAEVKDLLATNTLPAKANFKSSMGGHADRPSYVPIRNPFQTGSSTSELIQSFTRPPVVETVS
jgi:siderophore synthetase component